MASHRFLGRTKLATMWYHSIVKRQAAVASIRTGSPGHKGRPPRQRGDPRPYTSRPGYAPENVVKRPPFPSSTTAAPCGLNFEN